MWIQGVRKDKEVMTNRPDTIIRNKKEETWILIDVVMPEDRNVTQKETEKKLNTTFHV